MLTVKEAAEILGYSEQHVRLLIRNEKLRAEKIGRAWLIPDEALEEHPHPNAGAATTPDHARRSHRKASHVGLSFFTGAMGLDLGMEKAGFTFSLASEIDKASRATIEANRPDMALIGDIREYDAAGIRKAAGLKDGDEIDVIVGGPPCQAFSTAGKRQGFEDERGNVFLYFLDLILALKPKFAVIENVRGLLSAPLSHRPHERRGFGYPPLTPEEEKGGALNEIIRRIESGGYGVSFNLYNSANFGSPQKRERVVIVCSRDGQKLPYLTPTHSEGGTFGLRPWRSFREVAPHLPEEAMHFVRFPESRLRFYRMLKPGEYWKDLPAVLHKEALGASYYAGGGKTGFIRRIAWDEPTPTLVTHPAMPATDLAHPERDRPLSIEEYKRIQEFPDNWMICGSLVDQYKQVGNAVPISLGRAIGKLLWNHMHRKAVKSVPGFPYSRYVGTDDKSWFEAFYARQQVSRLPLFEHRGSSEPTAPVRLQKTRKQVGKAPIAPPC